MFHQVCLPPAVDAPARRRRRGTQHLGAGAEGEARARPGPGAYLVHGERHTDPVLLQ